MDRSVLETKHEPARHARSTRRLKQIPIRQRRPVEGSQDEKAMHEPLCVANRNRLAG